MDNVSLELWVKSWNPRSFGSFSSERLEWGLRTSGGDRKKVPGAGTDTRWMWKWFQEGIRGKLGAPPMRSPSRAYTKSLLVSMSSMELRSHQKMKGEWEGGRREGIALGSLSDLSFTGHRDRIWCTMGGSSTWVRALGLAAVSLSKALILLSLLPHLLNGSIECLLHASQGLF
jgi:hypothetical protein